VRRAARVSDEYRSSHSDIPWREIVGMRHKIVHDYLHVNFDIVWTVAKIQLPPFVEQLETLLLE
jgi:uncharacterized protein with HEPN domain